MCGKLLTIASMIAVVIALPVEHNLLEHNILDHNLLEHNILDHNLLGHNLLDHELIDLKDIDFGQFAKLAMTPHVPKSGHHIIEIEDHVSDKLKHGAKHISHLIESQKAATIGAALLPIKVSSKTGAVGAAIPALAAVKGTLIGSAIATPIIIKSVALPGLAAAKTAAILSVPALLTHGAKTKVEESPEKELPEKHNLLHKGTNALKKGALGAIGLAAKGALAMKAKAVVAGKLMLRPIAIITGAHLKVLGTGLTLAGKGVKLTGAGIKKVGTGMKLGGLGAVGIGATAVGWGLDKTTIDHHIEEGHKFTKL